MLRLTSIPFAFACVAACAHADDADPRAWLASRDALAFRERVVQLALIYGTSSGIDPAGLHVEATAQGPPQAICVPVLVVTRSGAVELQHVTVDACRHGSNGSATSPG